MPGTKQHDVDRLTRDTLKQHTGTAATTLAKGGPQRKALDMLLLLADEARRNVGGPVLEVTATNAAVTVLAREYHLGPVFTWGGTSHSQYCDKHIVFAGSVQAGHGLGPIAVRTQTFHGATCCCA